MMLPADDQPRPPRIVPPAESLDGIMVRFLRGVLYAFIFMLALAGWQRDFPGMVIILVMGLLINYMAERKKR